MTHQQRILHIMDKVSVDRSRIHGPARQIAYRVPFYPEERFKVRLCNLRQEDAACELLRENGVDVVSLGRGKFDPRTFADIFKLVKNWKPTVLHLHGYGSHNFGRLAGALFHTPVVLQEHFVDQHLPCYQKVFDWFLCRIPAAYLAVSTAVKVHMRDDRFMPGDLIDVLGNGVPASAHQKSPEAELNRLRMDMDIPLDSPVIGIVGRLAEMKGHQYLLRAFNTVQAHMPNLHLLIVGEGPERPALEELAKSLGLQNRVHFAGYQKNVGPFISLLSAGVVASTFNEGFNTAGVEILGLGVPLVITDLPCFHDLYFDGKNCLMVPAANESALSDALQKVLSDSSLKKDLIEGGMSTAATYSMKNIAQAYVDLYDRLSGS